MSQNLSGIVTSHSAVDDIEITANNEIIDRAC